MGLLPVCALFSNRRSVFTDGMHHREGTARVTIFAGTGIAQTFDYQPGDISYVPTAYGESSPD